MGLTDLSARDLSAMQGACMNLREALISLVQIDGALRVDLSGWPEVAIRRANEIPVARDEPRDRRGAAQSELPVAMGGVDTRQDCETGAAPAQTGEHPEAISVDNLPYEEFSSWQSSGLRTDAGPVKTSTSEGFVEPGEFSEGFDAAPGDDGDGEFESAVGGPPPPPAAVDRGDGPTLAPVGYDVTCFEPVPPHPPAVGAVDRGGDAAPVADQVARVPGVTLVRFSLQDHAVLADMQAAGKSVDEISAALGRSKKAVQGLIAYKMRGAPKPDRVQGPYSAVECDTIRAMHAAGKDAGQIAAILRLAPQGIALWLQNMERGDTNYPSGSRWTEAEDAALVAAVVAGKALKNISVAMDRPFEGLKYRVGRVLKERIAVARRAAGQSGKGVGLAVAPPAPRPVALPKAVEKPLYDCPTQPVAAVSAPSVAPRPAPVSAPPAPVVQPMAVVAAGEPVVKPSPWDVHLAQIQTRAPHSAPSDLELVERLSRGEKTAAIAIEMGIDAHVLKQRWVVLHPDVVTPKSQVALLAALRRRAGVAA